MNILFISPNSPFDSIGGVERYLTNLIEYYRSQSYSSVFVILPTLTERPAEVRGKVTILFDENLSIDKNGAGFQREIAKKSQQFSQNVESLIKDQAIDVICAENFHLGLPAAYSLRLSMVSQLHNIPLILRLHSFATKELQQELVNQLPWSKVSCISRSVTGDCFKKGTDIEKLSTNYLGVNTAQFNTTGKNDSLLKSELGIPPEKKIVLTVSRLLLGRKHILQQKGIISLIEAFSKLIPRDPNLILLLAIGKATASLQSEFEQANEILQGYIKLHNIESQTIVKMFNLEEMPKVYQGSDVFVLASENETFGQVFIEAMACGIPVIGTKVGGIPEIISDSLNGYLVPPSDASLLAQKIERLLTDDTVRTQFVQAGIETVTSKFSMQKQFASFHNMLEQVSLDRLSL